MDSSIPNSFSEQGYFIIDNAISMQNLLSFQASLWQIINIALKRYSVTSPRMNDLSLAEKCDKGLKALSGARPDFPLFVQAAISRSPEYYRLASTEKVISTLRSLMGLGFDAPLYLTNNGIIFTNPNDSSNQRSCNIKIPWHRDTFFTIPNSHFFHVWIPLLYDATEAIGALQVCPGSHKEGIGTQHIHPNAVYDHRYTVDPKSVKKYESVSLEVRLGQALIFDSKLIHKSGNNSSNHVRCTLIGLHHDVTDPNFQPLSVRYGYIGKTPEQYFYETYKDDQAVPLLNEQIAISSDTFADSAET